MKLARLGNKYLADEEPWKVIKLDEERVKTIMYVALQIASALADDGNRRLIKTQVEMGVAVRMSIIEALNYTKHQI